jgi:hypothetical protein
MPIRRLAGEPEHIPAAESGTDEKETHTMDSQAVNATAAKLAAARSEFAVSGHEVSNEEIATHVLAKEILSEAGKGEGLGLENYSDEEYLEAYAKAEAKLAGKAS